MNLPTEIFGNVVVVHAPEEVTEDHADQFEAFLVSVQPRKIVLDIDQSELMDSAALTALVNAQERVREMGGDLKIATASATNQKILEITRLDRTLEVFSGVIDAVNSYRN